MQRGARLIGMTAALMVVAFTFLFVVGAEPDAAGVGIAYVVAAAVVVLAPRAWATGAASAIAVVTGLLALVAGANYLLDGLILGTASLMAAWAAWDLVRHPDPKRPPPPEDR